MRRVSLYGASALLLALGASAQAQQAPNLVGSWKGTAQAIGIGANPYRVQENKGPNYSGELLEFVFDVTEQRDGRFHGTIKAGKNTEVMIGALRPPNFAEGTILDEDGRYLISVRDATTLDVCYDHLYPNSKVVACYTLKKQ